jgi:V-type H+-transporting ATPase subunit D
VNYAAGDISHTVREKVASGNSGMTSVRVRVRFENVSGVQLPVFDLSGGAAIVGASAAAVSSKKEYDRNSRPESPPPAASGGSQQHWLGRGAQQVSRCRDAYLRAIGSLLDLAALQTSFYMLKEVIRTTNRRVNALEHVLVPRLEGSVAYITSELDEQDREEFFRLKKIQNNKKKAAADDASQANLDDSKYAESSGGFNMLQHPDDADIFV